MIKGLIQEGYSIVNIYSPNIDTLGYIKQILMIVKGEINSNTVIVGDFTTLLISMGRSPR